MESLYSQKDWRIQGGTEHLGSPHSDKKKLNHQEEFLVTGLQRQVLIE